MGKLTKKDGYALLKRVRKEFTELTEYAVKLGCTDDTLDELMFLRRYGEDMRQTLRNFGLFKLMSLDDLRVYVTAARGKDFSDEFYSKSGLYTEEGNFLLSGRYIVPIRDISGEVTSWVGWFPDSRKYVTTPTFGFSKSAQLFNIDSYKDCWRRNKGVTFLVEGIFDTIALTSLGFSAIGNMGTDFTGVKAEMLNRYAKVVAICDNDEAGDKTNPYSRGMSKGAWVLPKNHAVVRLFYGVKDADDLVREYDCREALQKSLESRGLVTL